MYHISDITHKLLWLQAKGIHAAVLTYTHMFQTDGISQCNIKYVACKCGFSPTHAIYPISQKAVFLSELLVYLAAWWDSG